MCVREWVFSSDALLYSVFPSVSVTVGGKQYLLGLYDTAGQVSTFMIQPF